METVLEFYPADATPEPGTFVPLTRLEPARDYRMLLTNHRGLYRYPLDDVIRVEAWHGKAPVIAFSHRYGNTSSLTGEKLTEVQINAAMERALGGRALRPKEFQVAPLWGSPPRYLVVVEFEGRDPSDDELRELAQALDRAITTLNVEYASKRKTDRLGPPVLGLLRSGEFERMRRARTADRGRSDAQVKIPRLIRELVKVEDYAIQRLTSER
jgi:hypothetical protein